MEFKLTVVRLTEQPGVQVQTVAAALAIHPFMLSKWRKDARDGKLRGSAKKARPPGPAREIAKLQAIEKTHAILQEERDLLKKGHPVLFRSKADIFAFIDAQCAEYSVTHLCRRYGVTRAAYYALASAACDVSLVGTSSTTTIAEYIHRWISLAYCL